MIELPESTSLARQINEVLIGRTITSVIAANSPHKFAWYFGDPEAYSGRLLNNEMISAQTYGAFIEISLSGATLLFSDGVRLRLHPAAGAIPKKHQLLLGLDNDTHLSVSLSMYGGIFCWEHGMEFDNPYYETAKSKPSPLEDAFDEAYFMRLLAPENVQKLSLKATLATEQRIPGLGNGCLQDILWNAKVNPKSKTNTLSDDACQNLFNNLKTTLLEMTRLGGRNTEKNLFGEPGGYPVVMSAANKGKPCPRCGTLIQKEAYMGGSVYTCKTCQPLA
jgi:formamidopyrimidine-DNA glycosylase